MTRSFFLNPWYIVGFTDADGTFPVIIHLKLNRKGQRFVRVRALYSISQKKSEILRKIHHFFGFGCIAGHGCKGKQYVVNKQSDVREIVAFFREYPLQAAKREDFEKWSYIVNMISRKQHLTDEGILEIAKIRETMNSGGTRRAFNSASEIAKWLRKYPKAPSRRHYTLDEKDFVREMYLKVTDSMIAKKLNRTTQAIACLRRDMKLLRIER